MRMEKSLTFVIQNYYRNLQLLEIDVDNNIKLKELWEK